MRLDFAAMTMIVGERLSAIATRAVAMIVVAVATAAGSNPAQALLNRAFVSGKGVDITTCGPVSSPCRTLQYVHDNIIAAGGEVDILDPAAYGPILIKKSISIVNDGVGTAGIQNGTSHAIYIMVGAQDAVHLRGLVVEGTDTSQGGIVFTGSGTLDISNCVIRNFTTFGIRITGASTFSIADTVIAGNGTGLQVDVPVSDTTSGIIERSALLINTGSMFLYGAPGSSGSLSAVVSDTVVSDSNYGINLSASGNTTINAELRSVILSNNYYGIDGGPTQNGKAVVRLARSTLSSRFYDIRLLSGLTVLSYGDNVLTTGSTGPFGSVSTK